MATLFWYVFYVVGLQVLDAMEKKHYVWFSVCPNGSKDCHYRHDFRLDIIPNECLTGGREWEDSY
jgi:hypothetical protein